jgi:hypothetical protein
MARLPYKAQDHLCSPSGAAGRIAQVMTGEAPISIVAQAV